MALKLIFLWCVVFTLTNLTKAYNKEQYSVPEPEIEAFSPRGLRLSIPDSPIIKHVQFFLSLTKPVVDNDPGTIAKEVDDKQGSRWIYYNPNVSLKSNDMIHFKIIVKDARGLEWSRWGSYPIKKVVPLADNSVIATDCDDEGQQIAVFPNLHDLDETASLGHTQNSEVKSAYSMYKSVDTKPITRSTTTTTSGTFYVKPSGNVEASGYKSSSSFDSTRQDGEQWQHSKSELTSDDIEELKRLHGQDFLSLPAFAHLNHADTGASAVSSSSYHRTYSSSSKGRPAYGTTYDQHQQIGQTVDSMPLIRPNANGYASYSKYEKTESSKAVPVLVNNPAMSYSSSDSSYSHSPAVLPAESFIHSQGLPSQSGSLITHNEEVHHGQSNIPINIPSYSSVSKQYKKETVKTTNSGPMIYPSAISESKISESYEHTAPKKTVTMHLPLSNQPYYNGDVFHYHIRPTSPDSCSATEYSYKSAGQIDIVALERSVKENQCLSVLAETIMKAEVRALKEANTDLRSRLQDLEVQFQKFRRECKCY